MSKASLPDHQPASAAPKRKEPSTILIIFMVFGSVVLFCGLCMGLGYLGKAALRKGNENLAAGPKPAVAVSGPGQEETPSPAGPTPGPNPSGTGMPTSVGDGTWLVGIDIEPGDYKAQVPADSEGCHWARLSSIDGTADSLLADGTSEPGAQAVVTVSPGDQAFQTQGCGSWEKA